MLKKKNYKQLDHFTQYHNVYIPRQNGTRLVLHFKRYKPKQYENVRNVYQLIHQQKQQKINNVKEEYPIDRTLEILSFDEELEGIKGVLKKIGKVRKYITGETKYKTKITYYGIVVFKYQFDLVKCFRDDYFQGQINNFYKNLHVDEEDRQAYRDNIIHEYLGEQLNSKADKLKQLESDGYNLVTNKLGEYKVDYQANQKFVQELPQVRRQKKLQHKLKIKQMQASEQ